MTLLKMLADEFLRLRREESGVALMLTLSVFLLLYVVCAGVYSIGETVRQKIELQNACDSAAYSAAVAEADGLSRMAMINRAMSWTYVLCTNMQIDYITYRWLTLVRDRFNYDKEMCRRGNAATFGGAVQPYKTMVTLSLGEMIEVPCSANPNLRNKQEKIGWFCGIAGVDEDSVRLNHNPFKSDDTAEPITLSTINDILDKTSGMAQYPDFIKQLKEMIVYYNVALFTAAAKMQEAVTETAMITLMENLPRNTQGEIDMDLGKDFLGHVMSPVFALDPYEEGGRGCFSELYNTELGERIFLSMADNEVYDNLAQYFGSSGDDVRLAGGLDQWFVRSTEAESSADQREVPKTVSSISSPGICRVYKNANRSDEVMLGSCYRDHHHGFENDSLPSCINTHGNCPEQCEMIADSVASYAEYEWSSGRYTCNCTHVHHWQYTVCPPGRYQVHDFHFHKCQSSFLNHCDNPRSGGHQCPIAPGISHARSEYYSCWANGKHLTIPFFDSIEWTPSWLNLLGGIPLDCGGNIGFGSAGFGINVFSEFLGKVMPIGGDTANFLCEKDWKLTEKIVGYSNKYRPNGFARIYGDDNEIYDPEIYCGAVAKPWVLNESFYRDGGTITVGFARKQRNPWAFLLNAIDKVIGDDRTREDGIYSAFNPVENGYIVAFSSARAAHRFNPSEMALAKAEAVGYPIRGIAAPNEYETRYDAVCDDDDGGSDKWGDEYGRFTVRCSNEEYRKFRIGCVCNDGTKEGRENTARFARCWNLSEPDWDATLLPLRFAWVGPRGESYDSFGHDVPDGRRIGNITWEKNVATGENNPLLRASGAAKWARFVSPDGQKQTYDPSQNIDGDFLMMRAPSRIVTAGKDVYELPYSTEDPATMLEIDKAWRPANDGKLDLDKAIQIRIL